jgi:uncharacterized protein
MTGAFLNALGILLGGLFGLAQRTPLSAQTQDFFRRILGAAAVFSGLWLVWLHVNGSFFLCVKQILMGVAALTLGSWLGKLLRLQLISNRLGRYAGSLISNRQSSSPSTTGTGFIACTILFCASPLGLLGAVTEGLSGDFYLLAVKAAMDGLATAGLMKISGWPTALSAFPVYVLIGALTLASQDCLKPLLAAHGWADSVIVTGGFMACAVSLVILEVRKVELANYLPALAVAPLLAWLLN